MVYISFWFYIFLIIILGVYYIAPRKCRWIVLSIANTIFFVKISENIWQIACLLFCIAVTYATTLIIENLRNKKTKKIFLAFGVVMTVLPLLSWKATGLMRLYTIHSKMSFAIPLGLSFFSLQLIAYQIDVYRGKNKAQRNLLKMYTFATFFPQIIQGPIPRYEQIGCQLEQGNKFSYRNIAHGFRLILFGFFLKLMIADKAAVVVDEVFNNWEIYKGAYVLVAGVLYSMQLYTDFYACTIISQGVAKMFGIELMDNFHRPFFASSIKELWKRWHISLSSWLKDYIYIPLGGSRVPPIRRAINIFITFIVSGIWHGDSLKYIAWGLMHAIYQVTEDKLSFAKKRTNGLLLSQIRTFILFTIAGVIFGAKSFKAGVSMLWSIVTDLNPWILIDDSLFRLGLSLKEWIILSISIGVLAVVSYYQEKGTKLNEKIDSINMISRWLIYYCVIIIVWVFGSYGYGFDAKDFIYGGF